MQSIILSNKFLDECKIKINEYVYSNIKIKKSILGKIEGEFSEFYQFKKKFTKNKITNLDGNFLKIDVKNKEIKIKTDKSGLFEIYYYQNKNFFIISNNFNEIYKKIKKKVKLNNFALAHVLTSVAKRPPIRDTFFNEIKKLDFDQDLIVFKNRILIKTNNIKFQEIKNIDESEFIKEYQKRITNYADVGKSRKKIVLMSSGWDSLMILNTLVEKYGSKNVQPVLCKMIFSERVGIFNKYEIIKAKKICKHYGLKIKYTTINYKNFSNYLKNLKKYSTKYMMPYSEGILWHNVAINFIKKNYPNCDIYSGEYSDGSHNFGFSQYINLMDHENNGYREYGDKMMTYLFGPSFIKKLKKIPNHLDPIFKLLSSKLKINYEVSKPSSINKIIRRLLFDMFFIEKRFPFNKNISDLILKKSNSFFRKNFNYKYLKNLEKFSEKKIYSIYLYLYKKFHWNGSTVKDIYYLCLEKKLSFYNLFASSGIQNLLSAMPEKFGRGLEINEVKFPIKKILRNKLGSKIDELNVSPHSYLSDSTLLDANYSILFQSDARKVIEKTFKKINPLMIFDKKYFDAIYLKKLLNYFQMKNPLCNSQYCSHIYSIFLVCKFLEDINYNPTK